MKNKIQKFGFPLIICTMTLAACGGNSNPSGSGSGAQSVPEPLNPTVVNITHYLGTGTKETPTWIEQAGTRFMAAHLNDSYEDGKTGVKFTYTYVKDFKGSIYPTLDSNASDIFCDERFVDTYTYNKNMMDITDVVTPLVNKLNPEALKRSVSPEKPGKYFSLPHYEWFSGISYDVDLFADKNWYFADPTETQSTTEVTNFGNIKLVSSDKALKSVGPDGVRNTSDDGLPSSLEELVCLCDYIKESDQKTFPMIIATSASAYSFYLVQALWASLAGEEKMKDIYCNWTSAEIEVVKGFTDEELWAGTGIMKPLTEKVVLNDTNGYKMYDMVERYYALAFLELLVNKSSSISSFGKRWLNKDVSTEAKGAQDAFVMNSLKTDKYAMLYDSSYWYHEDIDTIRKYKSTTKKDRNVSYMPLPTQLSGQVTEGNGKKNTLLDLGSTYIFANAKTETASAGRTKAVKEFLSFLYTDDELKNFSSLTGLTVPANYGYSSEGLDPYYQHMANIKSESNVVYYSSDSERFKKNLYTFNVSFGGPIQSVGGDQQGYIANFLNGNTAQGIFNATKRSADSW